MHIVILLKDFNWDRFGFLSVRNKLVAIVLFAADDNKGICRVLKIFNYFESESKKFLSS
jgi:hypothetical protein